MLCGLAIAGGGVALAGLDYHWASYVGGWLLGAVVLAVVVLLASVGLADADSRVAARGGMGECGD